MEQRLLGASGLAVSSFALGTMTFGAETAQSDAFDQLDAFVAAGGTLVDLADVYAGGASEEIVGRWLASRDGDVRSRVVVATKGRFPTGDGPNDSGLSRRHLSAALDASLGRLGVDYVDLYQVHAWDPLTPVHETWRFLDDAVSAGKVLHLGLSNHTGWQTQLVCDLTDRQGWVPPVSTQPQYNLLAREVEWEIIPAAMANGLGVLPWSPLGGGWLTGKYQRDIRPSGATRLGENPDRGVEAYDRRSGLDRTWAVVDRVRAVADQLGVPMAHVSLAWVRDQPGVTSVILGARTLEQLQDNLAAASLVLEQDHREELDRVSEPAVGDYPYGSIGRDQRDRRLG